MFPPSPFLNGDFPRSLLQALPHSFPPPPLAGAFASFRFLFSSSNLVQGTRPFSFPPTQRSIEGSATSLFFMVPFHRRQGREVLHNISPLPSLFAEGRPPPLLSFPSWRPTTCRASLRNKSLPPPFCPPPGRKFSFS